MSNLIRSSLGGRVVPLAAVSLLIVILSLAAGSSHVLAQAPPGMVGELRGAAQDRNPGMAVYSVVRWGSQNFALTRTARGPHAYLVWERVRGGWSFIFQYSDPLGGSRADWNRRVNEMYARERFSTSMRRRLESDLRPFP